MGWLIALLVIVLLGGLIRGWGVWDRPLWYDEAATWQASRASWLEMARWEHHYLHPPLSFALVRASMVIYSGDAEWVLRLPALIAGIVCIPLAFGLGWEIGGRKLGLWTACLAAVAPCMVDQSQQARMYTLFEVFLLAGLWMLVRTVKQGGASPLRWAMLGVVLGLMTLSQLSGLLVWAAIVLALVVVSQMGESRGRAGLRMVAGGVGAVAIAAVMNHVGLVKMLTGGGGQVEESEQVAAASGGLMRGLYEAAVTLKDLVNLTEAGLVVYGLSAAGLWMLWKRHRAAVVMVVMPAALCVITMIAISTRHFVAPRYLVPMLPAMWVGIAAFATLSREGIWRRAASALLAAYLVLQTWQCLNIERWWMQPDRYLIAAEIEHVREAKGEGEAVVFHPQVIELLGRYYRLPKDETAEAALYEANRLRTDAKLPEAFDAPSVWVIVGMVNYEGRLETGRRVLEAAADHYGVTLDEAAMAEHLRIERVMSARIDRAGVVWHSRGVTE